MGMGDCKVDEWREGKRGALTQSRGRVCQAGDCSLKY